MFRRKNENPNILIASFIKNMAFCFPQWSQSILNIDYPKKNIRIVIIENDSIDDSYSLLQEFKKEYKNKYLSIDILHLDTGGQDTLWWDKRTTKEQYNRFVMFIIKIHNDFFPRYFKDADYWLCIQADNIPPPHIIKSHLEVFKQYPDAGMITGLIRQRPSQSACGENARLSARIIEKQFPPKPWRLDPMRVSKWGADSGIMRTKYLYDMEEDSKKLSGVVKGALCFCTPIIPIPVYEKLKMWYHVDDQIVSWLYQLEDMGLNWYLNNNVKLLHIDRDGSTVPI